jgi:uncharacterized protein (TIGR00266 family)
MRHEIIDSPDFALLRFTFEQPGEKVVAEAGAMVSMSRGLEIETRMRGGLLAAARRKLLGGETLFQNTFVARAAGQELLLAPAIEGDLRHRRLGRGESMFLQSGNYVAHVGDEMTLDSQWGGVKSFFSGVGLFMLRVTGPGDLYFHSYGAIREIALTPPQTCVCDTGHIVGFTDGLEYSISRFGGWKGLFFSGEGLVCHFRGRGSLLLQTRNAASLAAFLEPFRPVKSSG